MRKAPLRHGAGELPAVVVSPPETRSRSRPKPPRRERTARNPSAVQPGAPVPPQVSSGVTSGSATAGPAYMQPTAASNTTISGAEVNAQPFARPGEALEVVPGLIVTQHSGEGKANQYFLRGFNLDHGTDLAIKIDGMPVNMPTHGHGQGYADINFMIPELIQSVNVRKGPVLCGCRRLRLRRLPHDRLYQPAAQEHIWKRPTGHSAIIVGWRRGRRPSVRARCSRLSKASNTTARGTCRTMCASSTACCATARAPRPTGSRCRRWPIPTAGIQRIRWRSARSTRA